MDTLPLELVINIIKFAAKYHRGLISIYRYVCRRWRDLVTSLISCIKIPNTIGNFIKRGYTRPLFITWLRNQNVYSESDVCLEISRLDNLPLLIWAFSKDFNLDTRIYPAAAAAGSLSILNWLYDTGAQPTQETLLNSVDSRKPEVMNWCLKHGCTFDTKVYNLAVKRGYNGLVIWLLEQNRHFHVSVMCDAAQFNRPQLMKLFIDRGTPISPACAQLAAMNGNVEILAVIRESNGEMDHEVCRRAVEYKQLAVLNWLFEHYRELMINERSVILDVTLDRRNIPLFMWGLKRGCHISYLVCETIIRDFDLEFFKQFYMQAPIKPISSFISGPAKLYERSDILEFLKNLSKPVR